MHEAEYSSPGCADRSTSPSPDGADENCAVWATMRTEISPRAPRYVIGLTRLRDGS